MVSSQPHQHPAIQVRETSTGSWTGGALTRPRLPDLALLSRFEKILSVFDDDPAGQQALNRYSEIPRITPIHPPHHDLTDYWRSGGDLVSWINSHI